jgi:hypothetical protein
LRYKTQIWNYFIRYSDELHHITYWKERGKEKKAFFDSMENETFFRLLNTYRWLTKYSLSHIQIDAPMTKPTNPDILEVMGVMKSDGESLMIHAKKHPKGELRKSLINMAKKKIECGNYYMQLVEEDFFANK